VTLRDALAQAAALGLDRLDAQLLLVHVLGRPAGDRGWLIAHDDDPLDPGAASAYLALCSRRVAGEPVAYLTGEKEFWGLPLSVDARVLVPRPDTETLVEWALELLQDREAPRVIDLGTGSGAIALAIQSARPDAVVEAVDRSADALAVARANAQRLGLPVRFRQAHWLQDAGIYDLVVSNPPYVAAAEIAGLDPEVRDHEPHTALTDHGDGLAFYRRFVEIAPRVLRQGGHYFLEIGFGQSGALDAIYREAGFEVDILSDLDGIPRILWARRG